ncbi:hypothetical protein H8959_014358, partial [Pygathrix nigripes]
VECAQQTKQMVDCSNYKKLPPGQERFCHHMYEPICGSDGKTYKNDCFFCSQVKKKATGVLRDASGEFRKLVHHSQLPDSKCSFLGHEALQAHK